jgi:hypothetical protein
MTAKRRRRDRPSAPSKKKMPELTLEQWKLQQEITKLGIAANQKDELKNV